MKKFCPGIAMALIVGFVLGLLLSASNNVSAVANIVNSFNTRTGNVTLLSKDITDALTFTPARQADLANYYNKAESDARYAPNVATVGSLNGLTGNVALAAGTNVTITPSGNTLTISANSPAPAAQPYVNPQRVATLQWYEANQTALSFPVGVSASWTTYDGANVWVGFYGGIAKLRANDGANLGIFTAVRNPEGLAFDGANLWVVDDVAASVIKMRASDGAVLGTYAIGGSPFFLAFDGANMWIPNQTDGTVTKLRASDGAILGTFSTGLGPGAWAVAFDGANVWVTAISGVNKIVKMRASDGAILGTFNTGNYPFAVAFDGTNMWITNFYDDNVMKLRASDGTLLATYYLGSSARPEGIAFDGANMWVANSNGNSVTKIRASDGAILGTYAAGNFPHGVAFDGANVWVVNFISGTVSKF